MIHFKNGWRVIRGKSRSKYGYFSTHPRRIFLYRRNKTILPVVVVTVIVILATSHLSLATESKTEAIRHNHSVLRGDSLHHNVQKRSKSGHAKHPHTIIQCDGEYPQSWEHAMTSFNGNEAADNYGGDDYEKSLTDRNQASGQDAPSTQKNPVYDLSRFHLKTERFSCPQQTNDSVRHWHSAGIPPSMDSEKFGSFGSLNGSDSSLHWTKDGFDEVYTRSEYCVWKTGTNWITFKICPQGCFSTDSCKVRKCCPESQIIQTGARHNKCITSDNKWRPKFFRTIGNSESVVDIDDSSIKYLIGQPSCSAKYHINDTTAYSFKLLLNGTLVWLDADSSPPHRTLLHPGEFCIDGLYSNENGRMDQIIVVCPPKTGIRFQFDGILNFISASFLLVTIIVYILIWRKQDNIHSWLQFSYATSLFFMFASFGTGKLWSQEIRTVSASLCKIMGWISHLTYLSAFFWLTSMNFDLWWRFSRPLRSNRLQAHHKQRRRFYAFAAFSLLTPLSILSIGIFLDYTYGPEPITNPLIILPGFGKDYCYFENRYVRIPYLYLPAGILLLADFIFFVSTVLHLRKMHSHSELARTQSTSSFEDRKGVRVIAKLFVVMGVLWLFELLSWICFFIFPNEDISTIFMPVDIIISIQGVLIFFIFICKPNVRKQLRALFPENEAAKTWDKEKPHQSVSTVQQQFARGIENGRKHQTQHQFDVR